MMRPNRRIEETQSRRSASRQLSGAAPWVSLEDRDRNNLAPEARRPDPAVRSRSMSSIWVESLGRNFESALGLLEAAIRDCTDELWEASMWEVTARGAA